jgi:hypothetical protein
VPERGLTRMSEQLSEQRQRLIRRYMEQSVATEEPRADVELPDPWRQETIVHPTPPVDLEPFATPAPRLEFVRRWISAGRHRHPQFRLALVIVLLAVAVGWLVAHL